MRLQQLTAQGYILFCQTARRGSGLRGLQNTCNFRPPQGVLRCSILARTKLEPRCCSVLCKANVRQNIWVVCQAAGDWRPCIFREPLGHSVNCAVLGLDISYDRKWNQRACICRRQQNGFEIAEYSHGMDSVRLFMTHSSLEVLGKQIRFFMCRDAFFAQMICAEARRVY